MKTKRNWLAAIILTVLLMSLATPLIALPTSAHGDDDDDDDLRIVPGTWYKLESDIVTVLFPAGGKKPMFIWWYTGEPDQIYVVKYQGLIEWFAFDHPLLPPKPEYYKRSREAWHETWRERFGEMYFKPEENRCMRMGDRWRSWLLGVIVHQIMEEMENTWHSPFLPFNAGRWTLSDIHNITTPEGKIIGVAFAFNLTDVWLPGFEFAEDNVMIRVRFYNETTEETVPGTDPPFKYTVNAGEMKMDLVVNKWVWNIDAIKQLVLQLQKAGFDINIPEGKSRLALWVNLASINITKLALAEDEPEEIEEHSTATRMDVEDLHEDVREDKTAIEEERPIEISKPIIKLKFANQTKTLSGFFRFVSKAKITNETGVSMEPVKASYIAGCAHMRLFIGYPYFGNGTLEHDPSIGVDVPSIDVGKPSIDTTPQYTAQTPSGIHETTPTVIGKYVPPLFTPELAVVLVLAVSIVAAIIYIAKLKRKTPINMVGAS